MRILKSLGGEVTEVSRRVTSRGAILCTTLKPTSQSEPRQASGKEVTRCGSRGGHNKERRS